MNTLNPFRNEAEDGTLMQEWYRLNKISRESARERIKDFPDKVKLFISHMGGLEWRKQLFEDLLKAGIGPNNENRLPRSLLWWAYRKRDLVAFSTLVDHGANVAADWNLNELAVDVIRFNGADWLSYLVDTFQIELAALKLNRRSEILDGYGVAAMHENMAVVEYLLEKRVPLNMKTMDPFRLVLRDMEFHNTYKRIQLIRSLNQAGANYHKPHPDVPGETLFSHYVKTGDGEIIEELLIIERERIAASLPAGVTSETSLRKIRI